MLRKWLYRWAMRKARRAASDADAQFGNYSPGDIGWEFGRLSLEVATLWHSIAQAIGGNRGEQV
jgi:hypothetical protein